MKYDITKYLSLGAVLAGSAFMVSCDDDDSDTFLSTPSAQELEDAKNKPVAPVALVQFPVTSLKLSFNEAGGDCLGAAFLPGDELEIDFDSTTAASATDFDGNAVADLDNLGGANGLVFGTSTTQGFVQNIVADPASATWTIGAVYGLSADATGTLLLNNLTLTPLTSDLRSVVGSFVGSAPLGVAFNQDTRNVAGDGDNLAAQFPVSNGGVETVSSATIYEDVAGVPVEVQSLDGSQTFETAIGGTNYGISLELENCTINFAASKAAVEAIVTRAEIVNGLTTGEVQDIIDNLPLDADVSLNVGPIGSNEIGANQSAVYLTAGSVAGGISGSYRHDFDSSFGTAETIINSAAENN